ncbi:peptidase family C50-domain-containing protein [Gilbertella persicaria]|uniref:peptidase family C50-domain-containing protein n=1 Tax=Gilbertella persicaria TaxID=101096 RepID=UPI002220D1D5|nr:peptidase family C50-domain-containing protein [Gilbertella persicaria]KAI8048138.1 peptidase family C50-domain-containing protein [Gilbertella persicaria]
MQNSLRIKLNPAYLCLPSDTEWPINEEAEGSKRNPRWLQAHLNTLVELYREENDLSDKEFQDKFINILPPHWTVCSLTMDVDNKDLYMTRLRTNEEPFVVKLPLNRTKHRPNNTYPPTMQYEDALSELRDIIQASDDTIHNSGNCTQPAQVEAWWSTRKDLDNRLKILLDNIENQWLSGFKAMLTGRCHEHKEELRKFQKSINEVIFKCVNQATGTKKQVELNLTFCRMVLRLGQLPNVRDIEDVIYFSLACYEAQGVPIDYSRIDLKKLMDQIRLLNSRYHEKSNMAGINVTKNIPNDHLILILDKHLQMLPLESMPLLRPQSVSRLPCLSFLRDRILHVRAYNGRTAFNDFGMIATDQWTDLSISQNNAYYVLNPGGDLKDTQNEFESLFKSVRGWDGVIQRKPLELQMKEALQSRDLYMYFGHSAGQAFMRGTTVRQLPTCAVSLLMGCSSGILETHGEFDPYGYVLNYLLAGR